MNLVTDDLPVTYKQESQHKSECKFRSKSHVRTQQSDRVHFLMKCQTSARSGITATPSGGGCC